MTTETTTETRSSIPTLAESLDCQVLLPGEEGYDSTRRVWNADIDRYPAAIVRAESPNDVSVALQWCAANDFAVTVRSGGHNLAGTAVADGAVQIDTRLMNSVAINTDAGTVTVGAGCIWGEVDRACESHGIVVPAGVVSHTGVAGLTLGGGFGYLNRLYGATIDHLVGATFVVADGRILTLSETENADLFWAIKGAGHNYGVATSFTFRFRQLPGVATIRQSLYATADRATMIKTFRDSAVDAPLNVGTYLRLFECPDYWSQVPAEHRGTGILSLATVTYGDPRQEPSSTAALFKGAEPIWTSVRTIPHVTLQHATDDEFRHGISHYWKHTYMPDVTDEAIDTILTWVDRYPGKPLNSSAFISHQVMCPFEMLSGSPTRRTGENDALPDMAPGGFSANIGADWEVAEEKAPLVAWTRAFSDALAPFQHGTYINFTSVAGDDSVAKAVYGRKYDRLVQVKKTYDPDNVFRRGLVDLTDNGDSIAVGAQQ